jgi:serine/threonine protein kinase
MEFGTITLLDEFESKKLSREHILSTLRDVSRAL